MLHDVDSMLINSSLCLPLAAGYISWLSIHLKQNIEVIVVRQSYSEVVFVVRLNNEVDMSSLFGNSNILSFFIWALHERHSVWYEMQITQPISSNISGDKAAIGE